jgi:hypothetical protein
LWGANNIPNVAPAAMPANTPNNVFPVLMIFFYFVIIFFDETIRSNTAITAMTKRMCTMAQNDR